MDNKQKGHRDEEIAPDFKVENKRIKRLKKYDQKGIDYTIICSSLPWETSLTDPDHTYGILTTAHKRDNPYRQGSDEWRAYNFGGLRSRRYFGKAGIFDSTPDYAKSFPK